MKAQWILTVGIASLLVGTGVTDASVPDAQGKIGGCVNDATGVVRVVDTTKSGLLGKCITTAGPLHETALSWSQTGPAGAQGPAGPRGPVGAAGATGPTGATGTQGPKGDAGASGPTGAQGAPGPTGPSGSEALAGKNCPDGQVLVGFTVDGQLSCVDQATTTTTTTTTLPPADADGDGIPDAIDPCPTFYNPSGACPVTISDIRQGVVQVGRTVVVPSVVVVAIDSRPILVGGELVPGRNYWVQDTSRPPGPFNGLYVEFSPPTLPVHVGEVGILEGFLFSRASSLNFLGALSEGGAAFVRPFDVSATDILNDPSLSDTPVRVDLTVVGTPDAYNWDTSDGVHVQGDLMPVALPPLVAQSTVTVTGILQNIAGIGPVVFPYDPTGIVITSSLAG